MLTGELRSKVDRLWEAFWTGGVSNPLAVIEQITYLLFIKRLDDLELLKEEKANTLRKPVENPTFNKEQQDFRWSRLKEMEAGEMHQMMGMKVFPFLRELSGNESSAYSKYMKNATYMIPTANLLQRVVDMISAIPMNDRDTKGDLYEYLLSKLSQAGTNGQFRTPRHIIKMMVEMVQPTPEDTICDPSFGSAGFLVEAGEYLRKNHKELFHDANLRKHFNKEMFNGFEFDPTMIRIGAMNLLLHGIEDPQLFDFDALSGQNEVQENFSLILANPPFKGSLDYETVEPKLLKLVKTKKTELLFLALMLRMLKPGGRCAVIVPDGVLFGSSEAHKAIRKEIIEKQKLEAIISMPSGVFRPYAGVSTAVMIFTKTNSGGTEGVFFYDMKADSFSLDDKRMSLDLSKHEHNNIPDILAKWKNRHSQEEVLEDNSKQAFKVSLREIIANDYDLSINKYKAISHEELSYQHPNELISEIELLDSEKNKMLNDLKEILCW